LIKNANTVFDGYHKAQAIIKRRGTNIGANGSMKMDGSAMLNFGSGANNLSPERHKE